jgi:hypothetical protein
VQQSEPFQILFYTLELFKIRRSRRLHQLLIAIAVSFLLFVTLIEISGMLRIVL